jgi:hypothetical protein
MTNLDTWTRKTRPIYFGSTDSLKISCSFEHPLSSRLLNFLTFNGMEPGLTVCPGLSRLVGQVAFPAPPSAAEGHDYIL